MTSANYPDLRDRSVVVTGGASGIGEALVRAFAAQRSRVAFLDIQQDAGRALVQELTGGPGAAPLFLACDLTDIAALRAAIATAAERHGAASVLVNNAALDLRQDFATVEPADFDAMMAVNLRHVFFAAQAVVPGMRALGGGSIINLTSVAWMRGTPTMQAYATAKAGIVGFTNSLAREVGGDRIRVNAIAPGLVLTERQRRHWFADPASIAESVSRQCLPDPLVPDDIAAAAMFFAADASRAITKQCLLVNAGSF